MMRRWLLVAFSLWVVWAIRAHDILKMPAFVDESLHIMRAQVVFEFTDARASFLPAKLLTYYYLGLFNPQDHNGLWLSRQAIALLAPLSAALCFALTKTFTRSFWISLLVIWLYALTPFFVFFERLALSDPFVAVFSLSAVLASVSLARCPSKKQAVIIGALIGLAILAKLTALPLVAVPVLAFWVLPTRKTLSLNLSPASRTPSPTLPRKQNPLSGSPPLAGEREFPSPASGGRAGLGVSTVRENRQYLFLTYGIVGLLMFFPVAYSVYQELTIENRPEVVEATLFVPSERSRLDQIAFNAETYAEAVTYLTHPLFLLFLVSMVLLVVRQRPRPLGYLLLVLGVTWGFLLVTSAFPSTRYLFISFGLVLVLFGIGLHTLINFTAPQNLKRIALMIISIVPIALLIYNAAWVYDLHEDPTLLRYGDQDYWEYFTNSSSGFALRDAAPDILQLPHDSKIRLAGFVGNCHSLRLYFPEKHDVDLRCPFFKFNDTMIPEVTTEWEQRVHEDGAWYFLAESSAVIDFSSMAIQPELIATYDRPGDDGMRVWLYRVTPAERGSDGWFK